MGKIFALKYAHRLEEYVEEEVRHLHIRLNNKLAAFRQAAPLKRYNDNQFIALQ